MKHINLKVAGAALAVSFVLVGCQYSTEHHQDNNDTSKVQTSKKTSQSTQSAKSSSNLNISKSVNNAATSSQTTHPISSSAKTNESTASSTSASNPSVESNRNLTTAQLNDLVWQQVKKTQKVTDAQKQNYSFENTTQNGYAVVTVRENHSDDSNANPTTSPTVGTYRIDQNGNLQQYNVVSDSWNNVN